MLNDRPYLLIVRRTCTMSAASAQVRMGSEVRAILAADAAVAMIALRPKMSVASVYR
jgi:hypothetical protein